MMYLDIRFRSIASFGTPPLAASSIAAAVLHQSSDAKKHSQVLQRVFVRSSRPSGWAQMNCLPARNAINPLSSGNSSSRVGATGGSKSPAMATLRQLSAPQAIGSNLSPLSNMNRPCR
jgi:hypothetical protein